MPNVNDQWKIEQTLDKRQIANFAFNGINFESWRIGNYFSNLYTWGRSMKEKKGEIIRRVNNCTGSYPTFTLRNVTCHVN